MKAAYLNPFKLIFGMVLLVGMALSFVIGYGIVVPILSFMEHAPKNQGMPTPVFLILFALLSPLLFLLSLETLPERFRYASEAQTT